MCKFQSLCNGAIVILIWNGFSALATVYDSDGSSTNVQYIHDTLAQDGDTITLPIGTFTWATTATITKGIIVIGQTTTDPVHETANDQTIILAGTGTNGNQPLLVVDSTDGKSVVTHDNTHYGQQPYNLSLGQYRIFIDNNHVFGGSTGDNPWDVNATEPNGTHIDGHLPYLFENGTAGAGSGRNAIVDTTKNWTPNRWVGYTAKRVSDGRLALILLNTSNTLNVYYLDGYGGGVTWNAGDQYQIHRVLISMDQPCRGAGDLITGNPPVNSTTQTASWPHEALEPCYSWNDIYTPTGAHVNIGLAIGAFAVLQEGRDFYNNTSMPGYMPYVYPHPLVSGQPTPSPSPTATLTPTPSPTPTSTPAATPTATPTSTPTATATPTPTPEPSSTPTATPTATATPIVTATPRHTPKPHRSHGP